MSCRLWRGNCWKFFLRSGKHFIRTFRYAAKALSFFGTNEIAKILFVIVILLLSMEESNPCPHAHHVFRIRRAVPRTTRWKHFRNFVKILINPKFVDIRTCFCLVRAVFCLRIFYLVTSLAWSFTRIFYWASLERGY